VGGSRETLKANSISFASNKVSCVGGKRARRIGRVILVVTKRKEGDRGTINKRARWRTFTRKKGHVSELLTRGSWEKRREGKDIDAGLLNTTTYLVGKGCRKTE